MPKKIQQPEERAVPDIKHLWLDDVADHDYAAALSFLRIRIGEKRAKSLVDRLRGVKLTQMRANDILRACDLPALAIDDPGTHQNMVKTILGKPLSPVLVVSLADGISTIADGYHRVSWAYRISPWVYVPGRLATEHHRAT
ncbi:MAG: hypothetical protein ABTD50_06185 [Polyangiaceae bacterium]|jgi:hypothetical protein